MVQAEERTMLTAAIEHVRTLEKRRIAVVKSAIQSFLTIYSCAALPLTVAWAQSCSAL